MKPIEAHGRIDELGVLNDSHGEGTYALCVDVPNSVEAVERQWLEAIGTPLPKDYAEKLAEAKQCLYVGRSGNVYDRIQDHAEGKVRRASFLRAFGIKDIAGVWNDPNTGVAERNRARVLSDASTRCWTDGEIY